MQITLERVWSNLKVLCKPSPAARVHINFSQTVSPVFASGYAYINTGDIFYFLNIMCIICYIYVIHMLHKRRDGIEFRTGKTLMQMFHLSGFFSAK